MKKTLWIHLGLAAAALLVSIAVWSRVPDPMPIHWGADGQPDGFASRAFGLLLMPAMLGVFNPFVAWMCRKHLEAPGAQKGFTILLTAVGGFLLAVHVLMVQAALGNGALSMGWMMSLMGVMFAIIGVVMPMLPRNKVAGIRTPWTLKSESNWELTHRFGAWTTGIGGVVAIVAGVLLSPPALFWVAFGAIMVGSLLPLPYSYLLHRAERDRR